VKVLATSAADSSGYYRVQQPAGSIHEPSLDVELVPEKVGLPLVVNRATGRFVGVDLDCDVLVLQRPMLWIMPEVIDFVQARGIAVVVEIDDDFHTPHPRNLAFQLMHPRHNELQNWHHLAECVKRADLITVSTDQLARRYGSHGRVAVLRNYADSELLGIRRRGNGATLGWAGTTVNHPTDLQATRGGVGMAMDKRPGWRFLCVGGAGHVDEVVSQLEVKRERFDATEWKVLELHRLVLSQLDVGIVPLVDTSFNAAKSWLKGLEYAALGIPFVASDLPEYERLRFAHGIGELVSPRSRDWRRACLRLMDNPDRDQVGSEWREVVRRELTIEANAWRWPEAWREAWLRRRRTRAIQNGGST
jgi:glycosyltransferase involved in cell wall biosynthesis